MSNKPETPSVPSRANFVSQEERIAVLLDQIEAKDKLTDNLNKMVVDMLGVDFTLYTELQARNELLEKVAEHAKGLSFGVDWNKGTAAGFHREKLIEAVKELK